ncbi:M16 family metallopeptidase, partial [Falsiroseomonas oryzae]|uniref:M16 family metallopeptidase n=1 Tax=Falsiroseomonas oryzae TaxID=2766473 RepID=UPI0022EB7F69
LPPGPPVPRDRAPPPAQPPTPRYVRNDPRLRGEAVFLRSWQAPSLNAGEARHGEPLEVLRHVVGGGAGSRLHRALVETGLAVSAGASYDADTASWTDFDISAVPRREVAPERVEEAVIATVKRLLDEGGPTEAEVARATRQMTAGALLALDGLGAAPRMIGNALSIGLPIQTVEFWPARLRAVTRDQVAQAAVAVLGGMPSASGWLLPEGVGAPAEVRL